MKIFSVTFLVLVPKKMKGETKDLKDSRPISLVINIYKLLAKVLGNRLKKMVSKVFSKFHNAFMEGRQILNDMHIVNEVMDSLKSNNS